MAPSILLSLIIASFYGCLCHALVGKRLWQWPVFWAGGLVGFFLGYAGGVLAGIEWLRLGSIPLAAATLGSAAVLAACWFFSTPAGRSERRDSA
jgi:predicted permease